MDQREVRTFVFNRDGGRCTVCDRKVEWPGQLAHKIPQTKRNLHIYGESVIHHPLNMALVCGLHCNDKVSISNHPVEIADLVGVIEATIRSEP